MLQQTLVFTHSVETATARDFIQIGRLHLTRAVMEVACFEPNCFVNGEAPSPKSSEFMSFSFFLANIVFLYSWAMGVFVGLRFSAYYAQNQSDSSNLHLTYLSGRIGPCS